MSQLLSKISPRNLKSGGLRLFSSATSPYLTLGPLGPRIKSLGDGRSMGEVFLIDPAKEELVTIPDKVIPDELLNSRLIGSAQGWGFFSSSDRSLWMSDLYNPSSSKTDPKMIPLPLLTSLPYSQTQLAKNVAVSSRPCEEEEGFVVAIKFLGKQLSLYRHGRWTNLELPCKPLYNSNLSYSQTDNCFFMPSPGGKYLFKWDFDFKEEDDPTFRELVFRDVPELQQSEDHLLEEHWVESSSGESFFVKWYSYVSPFVNRKEEPVFKVFRKEETTEGSYMCYTEDIEDLCIFLSESHPFCVEASSCPGLEPNSIYYISLQDFAVYNLATKTCRGLKAPKIGPKGGTIMTPFLPYWTPPCSDH